jgi:hypothetical protein
LTENYAPFIKNRIDQDGWQTFYDPIALVPYMLRTEPILGGERPHHEL